MNTYSYSILNCNINSVTIHPNIKILTKFLQFLHKEYNYHFLCYNFKVEHIILEWGMKKLMKYDILVLDDEKEIADLVELYLKNENYNIHKFYNSNEALKCIKEHNFDLAILDVMLPDIDGFSICNIIRENHNYPIIMLTAKVDDISKIQGLSIGADDYITKPFNPLELVARVKSALRRYHSYNKEKEDADVIEFLGLSVNNRNHKCTLYNEEINLTPMEFSILWYLCKNRGKVVSSEELFCNVWGKKYLDCNNTVMVHIKRLREKLHEKPKNPKFIKTVWGVGYEIE